MVLDYLDFEALAGDVSFGRVPDGAADGWRHLVVPSPGAVNPIAPGLDAIRINEWMAGNTRTIADPLDGGFDDWFELHNSGDTAIDLAGCTLTDRPDEPALFVIPSGSSIPPGGFLLVWADDETFQNGLGQDLHVNFKLDKAGESISLHAPDGRLIDQIVFGLQIDDVSQGRYPDAAATTVSLVEPTPGTSNRFALLPPVIDASASRVRPDGSVVLAWSSQPGARYTIQYKDRLDDPAWIDLGPPVTATTDMTTIIDFTVQTQILRFYRIEMIP
jgi:hypothetical protein